MQYLTAPIAFFICAALGFWAVLQLVSARSRPPARFSVKSEESNPEQPWDGGSSPHRFGDHPDAH